LFRSVALEQLCVDDAPHRSVDEVAGGALQQRQRARAADLDLPEGAHVDHPRPLPERGVLLGDAVEPRWARVAEPALVRAGAAPRAAGLEVLHALPAVFGAEDRAQV